ncbi:MAG: imidazolonepropionase [Phycisphaerae bacterium]|nr:imidazolonepropionase [Phycisphaerae bacterium]
MSTHGHRVTVGVRCVLARALHRVPSVPLVALGLLLVGLAAANAQDLGIKAPPQAGPVTIYNATIHTVSGPTFAKGFVTFDKGVITEIGEGTPHVPLNDPGFIDAKGARVYPGLIAANTQLGLAEMAAVRASNDITEVGGITPEARAAVAVNPDSTLLPVTRSNGVLLAGVFPEGGRVPGRVSVMRLDGWTWEEMSVLPDAGLAIEWPQARPITARWMDRPESEQADEIRRSQEQIEELFRAARAYVTQKAADPATPTDLRYEAMRPVLAGARPVFITAGDIDQISAAVSFCERHRLRMVLVGGRDAPLCADLLTSRDIPVIITGTHAFPKRADSPYDDAFTLPARLAGAGVRFCIASADRTAHERNLPYNAATAVAFGLEPDAALKSLTLWPAQILGVDKPAAAGEGRVPAHGGYGSLEAGKSATIILTTGDPLEITTTIVGAYIDGRKIDLGNKQSALAEKYREKYRQQVPKPPASRP